MFRPGTQLKFCYMSSCRSKHQECGCALKQCDICGLIACSRHSKIHNKKCSTDSPLCCGWCPEKQKLHENMCRKQIKGSQEHQQQRQKKCWFCGSQCCVNCFDLCHDCGELWCKFCQKAENQPNEACCSRTQFHEDNWVGSYGGFGFLYG